MIKNIQNATSTFSALDYAYKFFNFLIIVGFPTISGWLAYVSPLFSDPLIICVSIFLGLLVAIWSVVGLQNISYFSSSETQMILCQDSHQKYRFQDFKLANISRYYSHQMEDSQGKLFWFLTVGFRKPIGITTIRIYGIDGSPPSYQQLEANPYFVVMMLKDMPTNKFKITFNETQPKSH